MTTQSDVESLVQSESVSPEVMEEFQGLMDSVAQAQRDPNVPEGTDLGSSDLDGMPINFKKQSSMHHMDGKALPDRVMMYRYPTNELVPIPTALSFRRLTTVRGGHRIWSREPFADGIPVQYIEKEVPTLEGVPMTKRFTSEAAYETFMRNKHGDMWTSMLRDEERAERKADRDEQAKLGAALLAAAGGATPHVAIQPAVPLKLIDHLDPDGLKAMADEFRIELSDRRSPDKMREELKAALETAGE